MCMHTCVHVMCACVKSVVHGVCMMFVVCVHACACVSMCVCGVYVGCVHCV